MTNYDEHGNIISDAEWYAQHAARVAVTGQTGSQFWMNADYTLNAMTEPALEVKAFYSDMGSYVQDYTADLLSTLGQKYGETNLSPNLQNMLATYPTNVNPDYEIAKQYAAAATAASSAATLAEYNAAIAAAQAQARAASQTALAALSAAPAAALNLFGPVMAWIRNNYLWVLAIVAGLIIVPLLIRMISGIKIGSSSPARARSSRRRMVYL